MYGSVPVQRRILCKRRSGIVAARTASPSVATQAT
jgi:hypothetical protein